MGTRKVKNIEIATEIKCRTIRRFISLWKSTGGVVKRPLERETIAYIADIVIVLRGGGELEGGAQTATTSGLYQKQVYTRNFEKWPSILQVAVMLWTKVSATDGQSPHGTTKNTSITSRLKNIFKTEKAPG